MERGPDGITCVFFCHDGEGNFVMHKRSQNCRDEKGCWDVGGGAVKFLEKTEDTVSREVMEEYKTKPLDIQFIDAQTIIREQEGVMTHWLALLYVVRVNRDEVQVGEPEKMDEIGWFRVREGQRPLPLHSQFECFLEVIERKNKEIIDQALSAPFTYEH